MIGGLKNLSLGLGVVMAFVPTFALAEPLVAGFERFHKQDSGVMGGALLFSELGCANCHERGVGLVDRRGPVLAGIKNRVKKDWLIGFLADPQQKKHGAIMPSMFVSLEEAEKAKAVEAVTHYLLSLEAAKPKKSFRAPRHANAERGSALYHEQGCVACHAPTNDFNPPGGFPQLGDYESRPVPFPKMSEKYSLVSLSVLLMDTSKVWTDGRMPHLPLGEQDAVDVAAHLLDYQSSDPRAAPGISVPQTDKSLLKTGRHWVESLNCASCHDLEGFKKPLLIGIKTTDDGCLSLSSAVGRPSYDLSAEQRAALGNYLKAEQKDFSLKEKAHLTTQALNCSACHQRDGIGGPDLARDRYFTGDESIAAAGRLPPPLTGIGQKLTKEWMNAVFEGKGRVRPYLETKMPNYRHHAGLLTNLFQEADSDPSLTALAKGELHAGKQLLGIKGGMNCITCHTWGDQPSLGIQALDISRLDERLKPDWFRTYLLDPQGYRPGTLMPPLWPAGQSSIKNILKGDTEKQIASIWAFIEQSKGAPDGLASQRRNDFELVPQDRPIIQRAFMDGVGSHAILVGFPGGVNLAYDGLESRPSKMWKGRFFDAYSTWFVRAAPFEKPLGEKVLNWPLGKKATGKVRFKGFQLDEDGCPTFLLAIGKEEISDHYRAENGALIRTILVPAGAAFEIIHPTGALVTKIGTSTYIYSWK